jgi:hypothetical protein
VYFGVGVVDRVIVVSDFDSEIAMGEIVPSVRSKIGSKVRYLGIVDLFY